MKKYKNILPYYNTLHKFEKGGTEKTTETPLQKALREGTLQEGFTKEVNVGENNPVNTKYNEGIEQVVESTGADFSDVDGTISNVLNDVKDYRNALKRQQHNVIYTNPDGSKADWKDIHGVETPSYYSGERRINELKDEGNYDFIKNVSGVIDKLDTLSDDDYSGFLKMADNIASKFDAKNTTKENLKILMNLDTSELKKYRKQMDLSKQDLLDLIVAPPGTSSAVQSLMNVTKNFVKLKDFESGGEEKSIDDQSEREWLKNWLNARKETGRFDDQLNEEDLAKYINNINSVQQITRDQSTQMFPGSNSGYLSFLNSPAGSYTMDLDEVGNDNPKVHHYFSDPTFLQSFTNMFDSIDNEGSTKVHELTHAMTRIEGSDQLREAFPNKNWKDYKDLPIQQAIKNIPIGYDKWYDDPNQFDVYERDPEEILAQLMEYRKNFNVDPNRIFTEDDIEEVKKNVKKQGPSGMFGLNIFTPENTIRLLNEVAEGEPSDETDLGTSYAEFGGDMSTRLRNRTYDRKRNKFFSAKELNEKAWGGDILDWVKTKADEFKEYMSGEEEEPEVKDDGEVHTDMLNENTLKMLEKIDKDYNLKDQEKRNIVADKTKIDQLKEKLNTTENNLFELPTHHETDALSVRTINPPLSFQSFVPNTNTKKTNNPNEGTMVTVDKPPDFIDENKDGISDLIQRPNVVDYEKQTGEKWVPGSEQVTSVIAKDYDTKYYNNLILNHDLQKEEEFNNQMNAEMELYFGKDKWQNYDDATFNDVLEMQKTLVDNGYDIGQYDNAKVSQGLDLKYHGKGVDGKFGNKTKSAWTDYQKNLQGISKNISGTNHFDNLANTSCGRAEDGEGNLIDGCSAWVNDQYEKQLGPELTENLGLRGNAWQLHSNIMDKGGLSKYNIFENLEKPIGDDFKYQYRDESGEMISIPKSELSELYNNEAQWRTDILQQIEKNPVQADQLSVGDSVGIYYPGSGSQAEAMKDGKGTWNTHVGVVTGIKNGVPIVSHNVHGKWTSQPYDQITVGKTPSPITWVAQPNLDSDKKFDYDNVVKDGYNQNNRIAYLESIDGPIPEHKKEKISNTLNFVDNAIPDLAKQLKIQVDHNWLSNATFGVLQEASSVGQEKPGFFEQTGQYVENFTSNAGTHIKNNWKQIKGNISQKVTNLIKGQMDTDAPMDSNLVSGDEKLLEKYGDSEITGIPFIDNKLQGLIKSAANSKNIDDAQEWIADKLVGMVDAYEEADSSGAFDTEEVGGITFDNVTLGAGKIKLDEVNPMVLDYFDIDADNIQTNDQKAAVLTMYKIMTNYDQIAKYVESNPELKNQISENDIRNMAIMANKNPDMINNFGNDPNMSLGEQIFALRNQYVGEGAEGEYYVSAVNRYADQRTTPYNESEIALHNQMAANNLGKIMENQTISNQEKLLANNSTKEILKNLDVNLPNITITSDDKTTASIDVDEDEEVAYGGESKYKGRYAKYGHEFDNLWRAKGIYEGGGEIDEKIKKQLLNEGLIIERKEKKKHKPHLTTLPSHIILNSIDMKLMKRGGDYPDMQTKVKIYNDYLDGVYDKMDNQNHKKKAKKIVDKLNRFYLYDARDNRQHVFDYMKAQLDKLKNT